MITIFRATERLKPASSNGMTRVLGVLFFCSWLGAPGRRLRVIHQVRRVASRLR
jgi:hypothetical protein